MSDSEQTKGEAQGVAWRGRWMGGALLVVVLLRLGMLGWPALTDNTESRYSVIAMHMAASGDWVTPRFHYEGRAVPFWGKPPLLFWLTAASFRVFGISEWSARLPGYLAGLTMLGITFAFVRRFWGSDAAVASSLVLASSLLFFGLAGSVTVDIVLALTSTAAMAAFACFAAAPDTAARRWWGIAFAAALALGMLAKGPIAVALAVLSVVVWVAIMRRWALLARYPWAWGLLVFFGLAAPWFWLAERATPGFLRYFIVNEHILRYLQHSYGDLYGSGHTKPYGSSFPMLIAGFLPWTIVLVRGTVSWFRHRATAPDAWCGYALVWGLAPVVFFAFARQLIVTYLLPGFAGLAVVAGVALAETPPPGDERRFGTLLRWQLLAMALALGGLAGYGTRLGAPAVAVAAAVLVGAGLLLGAFRLKSRAVPALVGANAVALGALVFLAAAVSRPQVDDRYSARIILERAGADAALRDRTLVFPFDEPDSAELYARITFGRDIAHHPARGESLLRAELQRVPAPVLLMERDEWERLDAGLKARLDPRAETPNWVACLPRPS
ncbi:MAG TPA: phospholipid carrier-dependent glycosyltransferase [Thermoanaerobaculaceae bacterium]|nr:phospholipid carrier-dependent glycosyltransferase [Thermoanaerobaculaceae bacterium]